MKQKLWEKYYQPPFHYDGYSYVWSFNDTMTLMFVNTPKEEVAKILRAINGEKEHKIEGLTHEGVDFFLNGIYIFCVRGWGFLTGRGAMNLPIEKAEKIQDSFVEYVYKTLSPIDPK